MVRTLDGPVVLIGGSLGAAVALQTAAEEPCVRAVVAAEVFSDLRTVARERAWFLPEVLIAAAFREAETRARFRMDEVSPADAAARVAAPVLLIHGAADRDTPLAHAQRVHARLRGPKRLLIVEHARHNQSLGSAAAWDAVTAWLDEIVPIP